MEQQGGLRIDMERRGSKFPLAYRVESAPRKAPKMMVVLKEGHFWEPHKPGVVEPLIPEKLMMVSGV